MYGVDNADSSLFSRSQLMFSVPTIWIGSLVQVDKRSRAADYTLCIGDFSWVQVQVESDTYRTARFGAIRHRSIYFGYSQLASPCSNDSVHIEKQIQWKCPNHQCVHHLRHRRQLRRYARQRPMEYDSRRRPTLVWPYSTTSGRGPLWKNHHSACPPTMYVARKENQLFIYAQLRCVALESFHAYYNLRTKCKIASLIQNSYLFWFA